MRITTPLQDHRPSISPRQATDIDTDKVDEAALALLLLTLDRDGRAWKSLDWEVTERLFARTT